MKTIARLVTRMQGVDDGLMIGCVLKDHNYFKPSTVYQIVEVCGGIMLQEVGEATPAKENETVADSPVRAHWSCEIGHVIGSVGQYLFLTRDEVRQIMASRQNEQLQA